MTDATAGQAVGSQDAGNWAARTRAWLAEHDAALAARFGAEVQLDALTAARAAAADRVVLEAWRRCIADDAPLALFAVGGYGRGELFPHSDIDLLVLADEDAQARHREALGCFFAMLWDVRLPVGHAVRSPAACTEAAADDITVLTAMLEARQLAGLASAREALRQAIAPERVWPARAFFFAKRDELRARHARYGDTADNLEPNVKEGPGGLRDLQTLRWMALRIAGTPDLQSLVALGQLGQDEYATLDRQRLVLSRLRFGLHLVAGKREERLRFDHQKALAARLGHVDDADTLAVERMMQEFYRAAALVIRIGDRLLQRFEEQLEGEGAPTPIDDAFELRRGYVAARDPRWPRTPADVFALFSVWAGRDDARGLHSRTARALAEALPSIPAYDAAPPELRARFLQLLRGPQPVESLTRMARLGVLGRWIPAFAQVSGRMQFDLFHVYTVDQHTLAVLKNLAAFASGERDERFAVAHEVWPQLRKPELLLLAGLFHDIGKGRGGDHSELGAVDARAFCEAHGLSEADTALVKWLVRHHLLMSVTAQKQDIADPEVIHRFASKVADRERLDHLYLLTCADIAGTSPKLWNAWKDRLLADLHTATRLALRRGLENPVAEAERSAETRAQAAALLRAQGVADAEIETLFARMPEVSFQRARPDQIAWHAEVIRDAAAGDTRVAVRALGAQQTAFEVFVHSPDRDGLFAAIVATLDRGGYAIQQARILDGPHHAVFDTLLVVPVEPQRAVPPETLRAELERVLAGPLEHVRPPRRAQPRHLRHFRIAPQIAFDDAPNGRTLMSLVCTDRPGLLADVAQTLRAQGLRVHDARIATFGERAEDVFQITDRADRALDPAQQQALREALIACLDPGVNR